MKSLSLIAVLMMLVFPASAKKAEPTDAEIIAEVEKDICAVKVYDPKASTEGEGICLDCTYGTQSTPNLPKGKSIEFALKQKAREKARLQRDLAYFEAVEQLGGGMYGGGGNIENLKSNLKAYKKAHDELLEKINKAKKSPEEKKKELDEIQETLDKGTLPKSVKNLVEQTVNETISSYQSNIKNYKANIAQLKKTMKENAETAYESNALGNLKTYENALNQVVEAMSPALESQAWLEKGGGLPIPDHASQAMNNVKYTLENFEASLASMESTMKFYKVEIEKFEKQIAALEAPKPTAPPVTSNSELTDKLAKFEEKYKGGALIYNKGYKECGMSVAELHALRWYTGSGYGQINKALRSGGEEAQKYQIVKTVLNEALKKLAPFKGAVVRGTQLPDAVAAQHTAGAIITYNAYTSTGIGSGFGGTHKFIIQSKKGRYVGSHSSNYGEKEVLFAADSKFKILEVKGNEFIMEEVEE